MRVVLISDVHSNLAALDAVLADAGKAAIDAVWHMGDLVGYGPDPDEVVARLEEVGAACVLGNHDAAAAGIIGLLAFNTLAAEGCSWTIKNASRETIDFLAALPRTAEEGDFTRVHGSLRDPVWEYLDSYESAAAHFALQRTRFSLVGHTHIPTVLFENAGGEIEGFNPADGDVVELADLRCALNPGSAGQPRDGDPRACYAVLDVGQLEVTWRRVPYDVGITQKRIVERGLPRLFATRLSAGR